MTDTSYLNRRQRRSAIQHAKQGRKPDCFTVRKERLDRQMDARCRTEAYFERQRNKTIVNNDRERTWWMKIHVKDLFVKRADLQDMMLFCILLAAAVCFYFYISMPQTKIMKPRTVVREAGLRDVDILASLTGHPYGEILPIML